MRLVATRCCLTRRPSLIYHVSATHGKSDPKPHTHHTLLLRTRYLERILASDPFVGTLVTRFDPQKLKVSARCRECLNTRVIRLSSTTSAQAPALPSKGNGKPVQQVKSAA